MDTVSRVFLVYLAFRYSVTNSNFCFLNAEHPFMHFYSAGYEILDVAYSRFTFWFPLFVNIFTFSKTKLIQSVRQLMKYITQSSSS